MNNTKEILERRIKNIEKDIKDFDLYEQFMLKDLITKGHEPLKAIELIINSVEGDKTQLSKAIQKYIK